MAASSTSTLAMAKTSAEADMLTRNSVAQAQVSSGPGVQIPNCPIHHHHHQLIPPQAPNPTQPHKKQLTLNSRLGTRSRDGTERAHHEVRKQRIGAAGALGHVLGEVGDL